MSRKYTTNDQNSRLSLAGWSMLVFGILLLLNGLTTILHPKMSFLAATHSPGDTDLGVRMFGMLSFYLGYYYIRSAFYHEQMRAFYIWTVQGRTSALIFFLGFVLFEIAHPKILIIPIIDYVGAIWTGLAVRRERRSEETARSDSSQYRNLNSN